MNTITPKRALISVSDKTGLLELAKGLHHLGIEIISTGGTAKVLTDANIPTIEVSQMTQFPEIMEGRVKTLHPKIFGGILAKRDKHQQEIKEHNIPLIDIVVCNLYPFAKTIQKPNVSFEEAIENIDVGGPSMIRAAAKNFKFTAVLVDHHDYADFLLECKNGLSENTRKKLGTKAFAHTAEYDCLIANYLSSHFEKGGSTQGDLGNTNKIDAFPSMLNLSFHKLADLRYGENPHQQASVYSDNSPGILQAEQLQGKPLSYNNIADADAALACVAEFTTPACVIVKHANPCGVSTSTTINDAFFAAWHADSESAFGGIVALNQPCTQEIAAFLKTVFFEVLIAPDFSAAALAELSSKKNLRILKLDKKIHVTTLYKSVSGGLLVQTPDNAIITEKELVCVTDIKPTPTDIANCLFAWKVVKHVRSNAIVIAKDQATLGIGPGQVSRVNAVKIALDRAHDKLSGAVLASDAFFPFRDNVDLLANSGISAIIQPGGSVKDEDVIAACNEAKIAMVFTGMRCFKH